MTSDLLLKFGHRSTGTTSYRVVLPLACLELICLLPGSALSNHWLCHEVVTPFLFFMKAAVLLCEGQPCLP